MIVSQVRRKKHLEVRIAFVMAGIVRPLIYICKLVFIIAYCAAESKLRRPTLVRQASAGWPRFF